MLLIWIKFSSSVDMKFPNIAGGRIGALLGVNTFSCTYPIQVIEGNDCRPHGKQTRLGRITAREYHQTITSTRLNKVRNRQTSGFVFQITRKSNESVEQPVDCLVQQFWKIEETGQKKTEKEFYTESNLAAIRILENTIHHTGERYENDLPWKNETQLQNNY